MHNGDDIGLHVLRVVGDGLPAQQGHGGKFERFTAALRHVAQGHEDGARAGKDIITLLLVI